MHGPVCADGKKKPKTPEGAAAAQEYAIVGGTVFRDTGFTLADAEVTLEVLPTEGTTSKIKKLKAATSPRGEFTFRVAPVAMKYRVSVSSKGYRTAEKIVEMQGGPERVDATFNLLPESKH